MRWLNRINRILAKVELILLFLIVLIMVLLSGMQIFLRKIFNLGFLWSDILLRHLVLWVSFLGASLATMENKHIKIDLLTPLLPPKWRKWVLVLVYVFAIFITLLLSRAAYHFVLTEKEFGSTIFSDIPSWPFEIIIPVGFGLITLRLIFNLFLHLVGQKGAAE